VDILLRELFSRVFGDANLFFFHAFIVLVPTLNVHLIHRHAWLRACAYDASVSFALYWKFDPACAPPWCCHSFAIGFVSVVVLSGYFFRTTGTCFACVALVSW